MGYTNFTGHMALLASLLTTAVFGCADDAKEDFALEEREEQEDKSTDKARRTVSYSVGNHPQFFIGCGVGQDEAEDRDCQINVPEQRSESLQGEYRVCVKLENGEPNVKATLDNGVDDLIDTGRPAQDRNVGVGVLDVCFGRWKIDGKYIDSRQFSIKFSANSPVYSEPSVQVLSITLTPKK